MTLDEMEQQNWEFVVLQEQSVIPSAADMRNEHMYPAVRLLDSKIRERAAGPIPFMMWAYRDGLADVGSADFDDMQRQPYSGHTDIAK